MVMMAEELPGIRAGYSLRVDIVTHLLTSMVNACSHVYLCVKERGRIKQRTMAKIKGKVIKMHKKLSH